MGSFAADSEEDAINKLKENIGPHVQQLTIDSVEYKGELDDEESLIAAPKKQLLLN